MAKMLASFTVFAGLQLIFTTTSVAIPVAEDAKSPFKSTTGFSNPTFSTSAGGFANCLSGLISVPVTASNEKFLLKEPSNQFALTELFFEFLKANSSLAADINGGKATISQTFNIAAKLCYPKNWSASSSTVQFLTHGIGFNQGYWDFAEGYSFIDVAAKAGYPTFSYDRLGVGASDHPDPIQIIQAQLQVEIIHTLVSLLRAGKLAGETFKSVVGVGHSFGSIQSVGVVASYPKDFDAVVLTGFSTSSAALPLTIADFNPAIASLNEAEKFSGLPNGYLVVDNAIGNQFAFYHYPNFDPNIFTSANAQKQTFTFGEIFTIGSVVAPSPSFTGSVFDVLGEFDFIFTQGNALFPTDQAALVQPALFPNASTNSKSLIVKGAGHALNLHFEAEEMFEDIMSFVRSIGL